MRLGSYEVALPSVKLESARRRIERIAASVWEGTANFDGAGMLMRGREYQPVLREDLEARVVEPLIRLARLGDSVAAGLSECPDPAVRRSAAVLAARAHPVLVAFDG
jgi:hypothetical protein